MWRGGASSSCGLPTTVLIKGLRTGNNSFAAVAVGLINRRGTPFGGRRSRPRAIAVVVPLLLSLNADTGDGGVIQIHARCLFP